MNIDWRLVLDYLSPVSVLVLGIGALVWGKQVIASKDAQIEYLKQLSAAEFLPHLEAMKKLYELRIETLREELDDAKGKALDAERKRLAAEIGELEAKLAELTTAQQAIHVWFDEAAVDLANVARQGGSRSPAVPPKPSVDVHGAFRSAVESVKRRSNARREKDQANDSET